jgi:hypothetical protein
MSDFTRLTRAYTEYLKLGTEMMRRYGFMDPRDFTTQTFPG